MPSIMPVYQSVVKELGEFVGGKSLLLAYVRVLSSKHVQVSDKFGAYSTMPHFESIGWTAFNITRSPGEGTAIGGSGVCLVFVFVSFCLLIFYSS